VPVDCELDVDVAPMRFEARAFAAAAFDVIDRHIHPVAIDRVAPGMPVGAGRWRHQLRPIGAGQEVERPRKARVQHVVAVVSRQFVEDHLGFLRPRERFARRPKLQILSAIQQRGDRMAVSGSGNSR
jgi:hypothetical protein